MSVKRSPDKNVGGFGPRLTPPVSYQGGKRHVARAVLDVIRPDPHAPFWDLCCGGAAIAMEAVHRGHAPALVTLVDEGPWGAFWAEVGAGQFDLLVLRQILADVPNAKVDSSAVVAHVAWLARQVVTPSSKSAVFLVLQAASWGGRAVGWEDDRGWVHAGWNPGWMPTATSVRRSRCLPLRPVPATIYDRTARLCDALLGVRGVHADVRTVRPAEGVAYLDPPYAASAGYSKSLPDPLAYAASLSVPCWVSERKPLTAHAVQIPRRRAGSVAGGHDSDRSEWLSLADGVDPPRPPLALRVGVSATSAPESENR